MTAKTHVTFVAGDAIAGVLPALGASLAGDGRLRVLLFCGGESAAGMQALEALQALKNRYLERLSLFFFFSADPQELDLFNGALSADKVRVLAQTVFAPAKVDAFRVAGPQALVAEVTGALAGLGVEPARILAGREDEPRENLAPAGAAGAALPHPAAQTTEATVIMDGRRRSFSIDRTSGETVLEAAEQAGLDLPFSCRAGVCSTCRTKVVKGEVQMAQNYALEPWELEEGYVLACQSHPTTDELELDYDDK